MTDPSPFWRWALITAFALSALSYCVPAAAHDCPDFTPEQEWLLDAAHAVGTEEGLDWGYTLAAITWRESFWGDEVRRENLADGDYGSYGVTQILLTTGLEALGWDNTEERREQLIRHLTEYDTLALTMARDYLIRWESRGWHGMVMKYNGRGERALNYADDVIERVHKLQRCRPF